MTPAKGPDESSAGIAVSKLARLDSTGLDSMGARSYDMFNGRFTGVDPIISGAIGNPQKWNRYAYALNSPLVYTDPSGLDPCPDKPGKFCARVTAGGGGSTNPRAKLPVDGGGGVLGTISWYFYFFTRPFVPGGGGSVDGGGGGGDNTPPPTPTPTPTPTPPAVPVDPKKDPDVCSDVTTVTEAVNLGVLYGAGEIGTEYLIDWKSQSVLLANGQMRPLRNV